MIAENDVLKSVRRGLISSLPLILIGSFAVLVLNLPAPGFQQFMEAATNGWWRSFLLLIHGGTFQVLSVVVLVGTAYSLLKDNETVREKNINPLIPLLVTVGCYFCIVPAQADVTLTTQWSSARGLLQAIMIAVCVPKLFIRLCRFNWPWTRPGAIVTDDVDMLLSQTLSMLPPAIFTFAIVALLRVLFVNVGLVAMFSDAYAAATHAGSGANKFAAALICNFFTQLLWFFGMHGGDILEAFNQDVFVVASEINIARFAQGLPATEIFTKQFFDVFVFIGGCGTTLSLSIALLLRCRKSGVSRLAKFSLFPGLFNINEIIVYGLPIMLNPYFVIPFILTPLVLTLITYFAMAAGLVPLTIARLDWMTPPLIGGYLATGSLRGTALQVVNLAVGFLIYLPFVNRFEEHKLSSNMHVYRELADAVIYIRPQKTSEVLGRSDEVGFFARMLARDIREALTGGKCPLHLEYQPLVSDEERVVGCEALLRWNHPRYGAVPPPVIVTLASEAELATELGNWVIRTAFAEKAKWDDMGLGGIVLSVNLSGEQLGDPALPGFIEQVILDTGLDPAAMEFELTENMAIDRSAQVQSSMRSVKDLGVSFAIDDFGMGHSSLLYIRDFYVDVVKIDGSLVKDIVDDVNSQEIVTSITGLCAMLNLSVVAEVVETQRQRDKLAELGCHVFQGFLYSRSLPPEMFADYALRMNGAEKKMNDSMI